MKKWWGKDKEDVVVPQGFKKEDILLMQERFGIINKVMKDFNNMDASWNLYESKVRLGDLKYDDYRIYAMKTENRVGCGGYRNVAKMVCGGDVYYYVSADKGMSNVAPSSARFFMRSENGDLAVGEYDEGDHYSSSLFSKKPDLKISANAPGSTASAIVEKNLNKWIDEVIPGLAENVLGVKDGVDVYEKFCFDNGRPDADMVL